MGVGACVAELLWRRRLHAAFNPAAATGTAPHRAHNDVELVGTGATISLAGVAQEVDVVGRARAGSA